MKKHFIVFASIFVIATMAFASVSNAQDGNSVGVSHEVKTWAPNSIFLELGGNGVLYSINYDRLLGQDYGIRVGIMYLSVSASSPNDGSGSDGVSASASALLVPVTFNYFFASHDNGKVGSSKFEVGAGLLLVDLSASVSGGIGTAFSKSGVGVGGTATIGYRYQPYDGGFLFRIGFTPVFGQGGFLPWPGLSFGYTF